MLEKIFKKITLDIGIDLGTTNTLVYVKGRGIVINEPSIVAVNNRTEQIVAIGEEAKKMIGRTPLHITATRPLVNGVISDYEVTEKMLKYFLSKVQQKNFLFSYRPRVVIAIPLGITEVERKAVEDATINAGAKEIFLVEEPMAAAIGSRLPVQNATGNMIVEIGGGTTEIAVISLGGIVNWKSIKIAGEEMNRNIAQYVRDNFNLLLGENTSEMIKIKIGTAMILPEPLSLKIRGRNLLTGLPAELNLNSEQVFEALTRSIKLIIDNIKSVIETTPPELVADIYQQGITLSGGGALLRNLDKVIHQETKIPIKVVDDPLTSVVRGEGLILEDLNILKDVLVSTVNEVLI